MKKIYSIIALMLLFVGSAWGDNLIGDNQTFTVDPDYVSSLSDLTSDYYVMVVNYNTGNGNLIYQNSSGSFYYNSAKVGANTAITSVTLANNNVVYINVTAEGTENKTDYKSITIKGNDGTYISEVSSSENTSGTTAYTFKAVATKSGSAFAFYFQNPDGGSNPYFNGNNSEHTFKWAAGGGDWSKFTLYRVTVTTQTQKSVTYRVIDANGNVLTQTSGTAIVGATPTAPSSLSNDYVTLSNPDPATVDEGTETITFTGTVNLPFTPSTSYDDATWYFAKLRSTKYLSYTTTLSTTQNYGKEGMWAFIGDNPYGSFQIINAAAVGKYLNAPSETPSNGDEPVFGDKSNLSNWTLVKNTAGSNQFSFKLTRNTANYYVQDYQGKGVLKFWNDAANTSDDGAGFQIEQVKIESLASTLENNAGKWGYRKKTDDFTNAINTFNQSKTLDNYQSLYEAYETGELAGSDGWVNINQKITINNEVGTYSIGLQSDDPTNHAFGVGYDINDANQLWIVTSPSEGVVNLYNANARKYLGNLVGNASVQLADTPTNYDIEWQNDGSFTLHWIFRQDWENYQNKGRCVNYLQYQTGNDQGRLNTWDGNYKWSYSEVESITLTTHSVDDYSYATICYPFAVTINNGTAYTVSFPDGDNTKVMLTPISGNVPAGMPAVVVASKDATVTATIAGTEVESEPLTTTALTGTYLPMTWTNDDTHLSLGTDGSTAGFYKWSGTTLSKNKAYIQLTSGTESKGFAFSFGGDDDPTGISEGLIREAVKELQGQRYNVQGQPVGADYKGIVIQNGKKYLQK